MPSHHDLPITPPPRRDALAYAGIPAALLVFHLLTLNGYGIFRDELYYLACADNLDWGFVDHPPLSILVLALVRALFGDSLEVLRLTAVGVGLANTIVAVSLARALGGAAVAQRLAALAVGTFPIGLGLVAFYSMNAFDLLFWTAAARLAAVLLAGADPRWWLAFGALAGLGLQNKYSVAFFGFGLVVGLLLDRRFDILRSRWFWLGGGLAAAIFAPHVVWQILHGGPTLEFMANARALKMAEMGIGAFAAEVLLNAGPLLLPLWLGGAVFLLRSGAGRWRPLGWTFVVVFALLAATGGKPYYVAAAFPIVFAAGGVFWERWSARGGRGWLAATMALMGLLNFAALAPFAKAVLPVEVFVGYAQAVGMMPSSGERSAVGMLPQHFADQFGWEALAEEVGRVRDGLVEEERAAVCVFAQNYGQAGAIDYFGRDLGLPQASAGHNGYWMWGPACFGEVWIVIGGEREAAAELFESVEEAAVFRCSECMPYEDGKVIWLARGLRAPIERIWRDVKRFV